jgi:ornithine cyclodeaminase/alanine dehydrogenase-like protein (mu-crystallin family)
MPTASPHTGTSAGTLLVGHRDVVTLLPMAECIDAMTDALRTLAQGGAILPLRQIVRLPDGRNAFALMPAVLDEPPALGAKVITVFPGNDATPYDSHQGAVLLFDTEHGRLIAIIDASTVTALRTAAVTAVATRLLSRPESRTLALLGAGVQAATHLESVSLVRPIRDVRVWSRSGERARRFAERSAGNGVNVVACATAREAVEGADVVCTVTSSREPVLSREWLAPGAHVNAVGASLATARELDSATVAAARLYVDRRESALNEAGDFLVPKREGLVGDDHIVGEIGELLVDPPRISGRRSSDELTVFKSLGLAIEDVAAARRIYDRAVATGVGSWVDIGGRRDADA